MADLWKTLGIFSVCAATVFLLSYAASPTSFAIPSRLETHIAYDCSSQPLPAAVAPAANPVHCSISFHSYVPSPIEISWNKSIAELSLDWTNKGCPRIVSQMPQLKTWLDASASTHPFQIPPNDTVICAHLYRNSCAPADELIRVPIEPLVSILRHPAAVCGGGVTKRDRNSAKLRKDWIFLPNILYGNVEKGGRNLLFDLGASLYRSGAGGASQSWFVEEFEKRGMPFDHIYGWEASKQDPVRIFQDIPKELMHKVSYYNVPVEVAEEGSQNPIRMIKTVAKKQDYVVLKIDIDTPKLEVALVRQMLKDKAALELVDEFFFEQHTRNNPMMQAGWGNNVDGVITESYQLFTELREKGVRAHSWV